VAITWGINEFAGKEKRVEKEEEREKTGEREQGKKERGR